MTTFYAKDISTTRRVEIDTIPKPNSRVVAQQDEIRSVQDEQRVQKNPVSVYSDTETSVPHACAICVSQINPLSSSSTEAVPKGPISSSSSSSSTAAAAISQVIHDIQPHDWIIICDIDNILLYMSSSKQNMSPNPIITSIDRVAPRVLWRLHTLTFSTGENVDGAEIQVSDPSKSSVHTLPPTITSSTSHTPQDTKIHLAPSNFSTLTTSTTSSSTSTSTSSTTTAMATSTTTTTTTTMTTTSIASPHRVIAPMTRVCSHESSIEKETNYLFTVRPGLMAWIDAIAYKRKQTSPSCVLTSTIWFVLTTSKPSKISSMFNQLFSQLVGLVDRYSGQVTVKHVLHIFQKPPLSYDTILAATTTTTQSDKKTCLHMPDPNNVANITATTTIKPTNQNSLSKPFKNLCDIIRPEYLRDQRFSKNILVLDDDLQEWCQTADTRNVVFSSMSKYSYIESTVRNESHQDMGVAVRYALERLLSSHDNAWFKTTEADKRPMCISHSHGTRMNHAFTSSDAFSASNNNNNINNVNNNTLHLLEQEIKNGSSFMVPHSPSCVRPSETGSVYHTLLDVLMSKTVVQSYDRFNRYNKQAIVHFCVVCRRYALHIKMSHAGSHFVKSDPLSASSEADRPPMRGAHGSHINLVCMDCRIDKRSSASIETKKGKRIVLASSSTTANIVEYNK